jgi:hypothetical protein
MFDASSGEMRRDACVADLAVGRCHSHRSGRRAGRRGPAAFAAERWEGVDGWEEFGDVVSVTVGQLTAGGMSAPSVMPWCFEPV